MDVPAGTAVLAPLEDDEGYVSPDFDIPSGSEDEETPPPAKRAKGVSQPTTKSGRSRLAEDEELALQLLRGKR